jgi:hypothetical protein
MPHLTFFKSVSKQVLPRWISLILKRPPFDRPSTYPSALGTSFTDAETRSLFSGCTTFVRIDPMPMPKRNDEQ